MQDTISVVLATGVEGLDEAIKQRIKNANILGAAYYRESVVELVERKKPSVVILSELLDGASLTTRELVLTLRARYDTRIIYLMKDDDPKEKLFLYQWSVFDLIVGKFTEAHLDNALRNPKDFKDIVAEMEQLKGYLKDPDFIGEEPDISELGTIDPKGYQQLDAQKGGEVFSKQVVAFWSVRDQAGKTFCAVNTALRLASRSDLKVLLLDFNIENPNVHIHFKFFDVERNLSAIIEDTELGDKITKDTLGAYLITHPVYKNLKILPGAILVKMKDRNPEFMFKLFEQILSAAEQNDFTTVLIDTESGIRDSLTTNILQRATKIMLFVSEDPGSFMAVRKCFDPESGVFVSNLIDKRKVSPVITKAHDDKTYEFMQNIQVTMETHVGAIVPYSDDVRKSLYAGVPIFSKSPSEEFQNSFISIANLIHRKAFAKNSSKSFVPAPPGKPGKKGKAPASAKAPSAKTLAASGASADALKRIVAQLIDGVPVGFAGGGLMTAMSISDPTQAPMGAAFAILISVLYGALMESSNWQATLGKKLMGISVVGVDGEKLSLVSALTRNVVKTLLGPITYIWALLKQRGLHDLAGKSQVVNK